MSKKQITIPIFIPHKGCPNCCVFCNQWRISSASQIPDPGSIRDTIALYLSRLRSSVDRVEAAFFGGSFTAIPMEEQRGYLSVIKPYIDDGIIHSIRISTRPDAVNVEILDLLSQYGVETVELGVQSFSNRVLELAGRGHSVEDVFRAMELLKKYRFRTGIQLMPGLPGDDFDASIRSAETAVSLGAHDARIYPVVVLKDTALEQMYLKGEYTPLTLEEAVAVCAEIYTIYNDNNVNVIRIGLHPVDMGSSTVVAGPYHTALGFLVKARYRRALLETLMRGQSSIAYAGEGITLVIPLDCAEEYIGMKKGNIDYLKELFALKELKYSIRAVEKPVLEL